MFLLDSNVFIEAKNRYYAFDLAPVFWEWLDELCEQEVRTITNIRDELLDGSDELADWMRDRKDQNWILSTDDENTQNIFAGIANEVAAGNYRPAAMNDFLSKADPWLIAKAMDINATIVTHEVAELNARRRVPLPNLCPSRAITCMNTFDFLRIHAKRFTT